MNYDLSIDKDEYDLIDRAMRIAWSDFSEEDRSRGNHFLNRMMAARGCGGARYAVSFEAPATWSPEAIGAAIQTEFFWDGSVLAAYYKNESIKLRGDGRWQVELLREDCEADYHECYAGDEGHDGSDEAAIRQVRGELDEALTTAAIISDVRVESRRTGR